MTKDEALQLKPGDQVEHINGNWAGLMTVAELSDTSSELPYVLFTDGGFWQCDRLRRVAMTHLPDPKEVAHAIILDNSFQDQDEPRRIIRVDLLELRIEAALRACDEWWKRENDKLETSVNALRINATGHREGCFCALCEPAIELLELQAQQAEMVKALEQTAPRRLLDGSLCFCVLRPLDGHNGHSRACIEARAILAKVRGQEAVRE